MATKEQQTGTDLFGTPIDPPRAVKPAKSRPVTNDMDLIERVLQVARTDGYALVGVRERIYRVTGKDRHGVLEITGIPEVDANAVHQLIESKNLAVGGQHCYRHRNRRESTGRAVLVPRATQAAAARWEALHRPSTWPHHIEREVS